MAGLLLFPAAAGAEIDIEIEIDEWLDEIDPYEVPGGIPLPPVPPPPEGEGYPTGGPGAPTRLIRIADAAYEDGFDELSGADRPNPRVISQGVIRQDGQDIRSPNDLSDMVWQWGQFLDHDIGITEPPSDPADREPLDIIVPLNDPWFDPLGECEGEDLPEHCFIRTFRSGFDPATGGDADPPSPREQLNDLTALIDADNVYGHDPDRTAELRDPLYTPGHCGRLKTSPGDFLPFNVNGFPNAPGPAPWFFLAGDIRVNETVPLSAMHTLWMREHNTLADAILQKYPGLGGTEEGCDAVFGHARRMVITEMQIITFREFLPAWLGGKAFPKYTGYDGSDPGMVSVVSTAFYRLGHTMLSPNILRLRPDGSNFLPPLDLRDAFFQCFPPEAEDPGCRLIDRDGLEPVLKGLSEKVMQRIDSFVIDDVRNFLFGPPPNQGGEGPFGLDLPALNINRARDHGLPDYNTYREVYFGLEGRYDDIGDITDDLVVVDRLRDTYGWDGIDRIDPWVGALSEKPLGKGILVGELLFAGLTDQFLRIRNGDFNWYQNILSTSEQRAAEKQTLAKVIARNTDLDRKDLNANVFIVK